MLPADLFQLFVILGIVMLYVKLMMFVCNVSVDEAGEDSSDSTTKKKCKRRWGAKSRWADSDELEKETVLSGLPTVIPSGLTKEQEEQYLGESLVLLLL